MLFNFSAIVIAIISIINIIIIIDSVCLRVAEKKV